MSETSYSETTTYEGDPEELRAELAEARAFGFQLKELADYYKNECRILKEARDKRCEAEEQSRWVRRLSTFLAVALAFLMGGFVARQNRVHEQARVASTVRCPSVNAFHVRVQNNALVAECF